jgi:hypothetical protein
MEETTAMATTATMSNRQAQSEGGMSAHALGVAAGALLGCSHLGWAILVATGLAQPIIDFVFWLHFIEPPYRVGPFAWSRAIGLIAVTSGIGYVLGAFAGIIWSRLDTARS